uniref:Putative secreted protein n=1 Tax=Anopheles darlingi TaxID=43151 RepID=A0A2M4CLG1_ANODA
MSRTASSSSISVMLSGSDAHSFSVFAMFSSSGACVMLSRFTSNGMPPHVRSSSRLFWYLTHSEIAPTTFVSTSSFSSFSSCTSTCTVFSWSSFFTFASLAAHFQMAPVAAASSCLLSRTVLSRAIPTSGSRPPDSRTISLAVLSLAHLKMAELHWRFRSRLSDVRWDTMSKIMPSVVMASW